MSIDARRQELAEELVAWLADWNDGESPVEPGPDTDLLSSGLLDSMGLVAMIAFLEERLDLRFDFEVFDPTAHVTPRTLIALCLEPRAAG